MKKEKSVLIVFPDEWLQYSPSVLNLYECFSENHYTKLIYIDNGHFNNEGLVPHYKKIKISSFAAYFWRKTLGYKFYKILRLFLNLILIKLFDKRYDIVVAIDSSGYLPTKLLFKHAIYFSLEAEKDIYYKLSKLQGIQTLLIQSKERKEFMCSDEQTKTYYIQNAPILKEKTYSTKGEKKKAILYMGNIEFGYGLEQFIECIKELDNNYSLTLKGIKNERFFNFLQQKYQDIISSGKLIFDFNYTQQPDVIRYVSSYYIGITGYDLELAKKSFNYFSSPAGKLFNYYAAGIPVIGIDITGLKSAKDYGAGVLLDGVTPEKINKAILTIENNYETYSENCLKAAKDFDFKRSFDLFMQKFNENKK